MMYVAACKSNDNEAVLSIYVSGVLKSRTIIVLLSVSPSMSASICFIYLCAPILGVHYITECNILFLYWFLYYYLMIFLVFCYSLCFKVGFVWYEYCHPSYHFHEIFFHPLTFSRVCVCVFGPEVSLL